MASLQEFIINAPYHTQTVLKARSFKEGAIKFVQSLGNKDLTVIRSIPVESDIEMFSKKGTERHYIIVPKGSIIAKDIVWDTDGEDIELPKDVFICTEDKENKINWDSVTDGLSSHYGFCVQEYMVEKAK